MKDYRSPAYFILFTLAEFVFCLLIAAILIFIVTPRCIDSDLVLVQLTGIVSFCCGILVGGIALVEIPFKLVKKFFYNQ